MATCWVISPPMERPDKITGGVQIDSMSSAQSLAKSAIDHGAASDVVSPTPRGSYEVERYSLAKSIICWRHASAGESPPGTQTMSGPVPIWAARIRAPEVCTCVILTSRSNWPNASVFIGLLTQLLGSVKADFLAPTPHSVDPSIDCLVDHEIPDDAWCGFINKHRHEALSSTSHLSHPMEGITAAKYGQLTRRARNGVYAIAFSR